MAIDSDIPNPDSHLQVTFYQRLVRNNFKTEESGVPHDDPVDYIKIEIPGNKYFDIDAPAREEHKKRFPMHWAAYQNREGSMNSMVGIPITDWPRVASTPKMVEDLRYLRFATVEAIAGASDGQLQSIGMISGQSAFSLRDEAKRFLLTKNAEATMSIADKKHAEADAKLEEANQKLADQREQHAKDMAEMNEKMKQMMDMVSKLAPASEPETKRGPGRPKEQ